MGCDAANATYGQQHSSHSDFSFQQTQLRDNLSIDTAQYHPVRVCPFIWIIFSNFSGKSQVIQPVNGLLVIRGDLRGANKFYLQ